MTFEEFLDICRTKDGWINDDGIIRNNRGECPLEVVFGTMDYRGDGRRAGLNVRAIMNAADDYLPVDDQIRQALLTLIQPSQAGQQ